MTLVGDDGCYAVLAQKRFEIGSAAAREGDAQWEVFGARYHPRCSDRRKPHALLSVELRILESREALDLVQQR